MEKRVDAATRRSYTPRATSDTWLTASERTKAGDSASAPYIADPRAGTRKDKGMNASQYQDLVHQMITVFVGTALIIGGGTVVVMMMLAKIEGKIDKLAARKEE
jgi:hypothetical protein